MNLEKIGVQLNEDFYGLFKCKHTGRVCTNKKESIFMILKNIGEKLKTALSLVLACITGRAYYFTLLWKMVQYFIAYQLARLFNVDLPIEDVPNKKT